MEKKVEELKKPLPALSANTRVFCLSDNLCQQGAKKALILELTTPNNTAVWKGMFSILVPRRFRDNALRDKAEHKLVKTVDLVPLVASPSGVENKVVVTLFQLDTTMFGDWIRIKSPQHMTIAYNKEYGVRIETTSPEWQHFSLRIITQKFTHGTINSMADHKSAIMLKLGMCYTDTLLSERAAQLGISRRPVLSGLKTESTEKPPPQIKRKQQDPVLRDNVSTHEHACFHTKDRCFTRSATRHNRQNRQQDLATHQSNMDTVDWNVDADECAQIMVLAPLARQYGVEDLLFENPDLLELYPISKWELQPSPVFSATK